MAENREFDIVIGYAIGEHEQKYLALSTPILKGSVAGEN